MFTLQEYLLLEQLIDESAINSAELNKDLKFEKTTKDELINILDTDDYDHGKVLGLDDIEDFDNLWLSEAKEEYYKIQYKENILGVFGVVDGKKLKDILEKKDNKYYHTIFGIHAIWMPLVFNSLMKYDTKFDVLNLKPEEIENGKEFVEQLNSMKNDVEKFQKFILIQHTDVIKNIISHTCYIGLWAINQNVKKQIDVSDFALVKVFFQMLLKFLKESNCDFIWAHGKDERTAKMYEKLGGFTGIQSFLTKITKKLYYSKYHLAVNYFNGCVIKCINENRKFENLHVTKLSQPQTTKNQPTPNKSKTPNKSNNNSQTTDNELMKTIKKALEMGYISSGNLKYGVSKENIYDLFDETEYTKDHVERMINAIIKSGVKIRYNTNKEWKKAGYLDPSE